MKNKFISIYSVIAFSIVFLSILFFIFSLRRSVAFGTLEAEKTYNRFAQEISNTLASGTITDIPGRITALCVSSQSLQSIDVSFSGRSVYSWPGNRQGSSGTSLFVRTISRDLNLSVPGMGSAVLTMEVSVLLPEHIFYASRTVFFILLALLFATILVLICSKPSVPVKKEQTAPEFGSGYVYNHATEPTLHEGSFDEFQDEPPQSEADPIDGMESPVVEAGYPLNELQDAQPGERAEASKADVRQEIVPQEIDSAGESSSPEGLFSPFTGIGWEEYLIERLDAELVRAASSEQDLALVAVRISGLKHTDFISRKIAGILLDTFRFRDMVFELGSDGFAGILQNMNLDSAMKVCDALYSDIDALSMELEYEGQISIGITTRTSRLLPASRMLEEALTAAKKAAEEPALPIVAFRANPDKYRNYIADTPQSST